MCLLEKKKRKKKTTRKRWRVEKCSKYVTFGALWSTNKALYVYVQELNNIPIGISNGGGFFQSYYRVIPIVNTIGFRLSLMEKFVFFFQINLTCKSFAAVSPAATRTGFCLTRPILNIIDSTGPFFFLFLSLRYRGTFWRRTGRKTEKKKKKLFYIPIAIRLFNADSGARTNGPLDKRAVSTGNRTIAYRPGRVGGKQNDFLVPEM